MKEEDIVIGEKYIVNEGAPYGITRPGTIVVASTWNGQSSYRYYIHGSEEIGPGHEFTLQAKYLSPVAMKTPDPWGVRVNVNSEFLRTQIGGSHYRMAIEPIEFIVKNDIPYREGNVIKYVTRHKKKNGAEDIRKAIHYLEMILSDYDEEKEDAKISIEGEEL